jgi:hypothetical protein
LDGGGTWALIEVKALMKIYGNNARGHDVLRDFDLVAANSGGSIVAAALACDFQLQEILGYFKDPAMRAKIFAPLPWYSKLNPVGWFLPAPKYDASAKLHGLRNAFATAKVAGGDMPLEQLPGLWGGKPDLIFASFDYDRERAVMFRTNPNSPAHSGAPRIPATLAEAVHASTNAPLKYFDQPAMFANRRFWDGAMAGLNNPILIGVAEALACNGPAARGEIKVRSLGTGSVFLPLQGAPAPLVQPRMKQNYFKDLEKTAGCILDDPPDEATFMAYAMLDGRFAPPFPIASDIVVRMSPLIQPVRKAEGSWQLPGADLPQPPLTVDDFNQLVALGLDPDAAGVELIERFCNAWLNDLVPNQPIRANSDTLVCEIGHARFSAAKRVW